MDYAFSSTDEDGHMSYTDSYFERQEYPVGPIFPFTFASTFKRGADPDFDHFLLHPENNIIQSRSRWRNQAAESIEFISSRMSLRNQKYIQHLAIDLTCYRDIGSQDFRRIIAVMTKSFPSLRYLYLIFQKESLTDKDLTWFSSHITKYMTNLKHLFIQFHQNNKITSTGIKVFCKQIGKKLKRLECLILDFSRCPKSTNKSFRSLTHFASNYLCNLKDFRIISSKVSDSAMQKIHFNKTRYLKQLESLHLFLDAGAVNPLNGSKTILSQRRFKSDLRQLSLYFVNLTQTFSEKGLDYLSSCCLRGLQNLKTLNIHVESLNIDLEAVQTFVKVLNAQISTLESLKICSKLSDSFTYEFLDRFECPENNQLKKLEMQFISKNQQEDDEVEKEGDEEDGSEVEEDLEEGEGIVIEDIEDLEDQEEQEEEEQEEEEGHEEKKEGGKEEKSIPLLSILTFVSKSMQYLKNLTYLDFLFESVDIKDKQVKHLTSCIAQNLPKLEFININFFLCSTITGESVAAFQKDFCAENALPNLKTLCLTFSSCNQITTEHIRALEDSLRNQKPSIESTHVNFVDYNSDSSWKSSEVCDLFSYEGISDCEECTGYEHCRYHRQESDNSNEYLTDFLDDDSEDASKDDNKQDI